MHLEEFAEGGSFFHRLDPRVKFIAFIPFAFTVAMMNGIESLLAGLLVSALMAVTAGLDLRKLLSRLIVVNIPIALLWLFLPFTYPGEGIFNIGAFAATREGIIYAFSITLKANVIAIATIALLGTSEIFSLAHALVHLKAPVKLVYLFFFFYRYISVIHAEYLRLRKAMKVRCFKPKTDMHTYRMLANLTGMLIVRSYERSQRIYNAMLCRGFRGTFPVTSHFKLKGSDVAFGVIMAFITLTLIIV